MHQRLHASLLLLVSALGASCHLMVGSRGENEDSPEGRACGTITCAEGNVCCNASCGICTAPDRVCIQIACDPASAGKTCRDLQCEPDEMCLETRPGPQCVPHDENPCNALLCRPGTVCIVEQGAAACVPPAAADGGVVSPGLDAAVVADASTPAAEAGNPLADASLPSVDASLPGVDASLPQPDASLPQPEAGPVPNDAGTTRPDAGSPVRDGGIVIPPGTCAVTLCPAGTYCDDISGVAKCIKLPSCAGVKCAAGTHCELEQVQCVRAPCPPQPACVPDPPGDPCAAVRCKMGTHCELTWGQCDSNSCKQVPECVEDGRGGGKCGNTECGPGTFCCNASCGVCAPKNGACTQQICASEY